jgi:hypothetical protein
MVNFLIQRHLEAKAVSGISRLAKRIDGDLANDLKLAVEVTG